MKKTFTININGIVFHIDEDAYEILQAYLGKISSRFSNTEEGKEIIDDIEGRIAELFSERLKDNKEVITINDVEEIIEIMGQPEDIINEEEVSSEGKSSPRYWRSRTGKRVYRDTDERILGGVCSGIAAYFGLYPIILRIIFVILCFIPAGSGLLIYIILWIIIPEAKTTAQKLEMKGEKVNVGNIEKSIKDEFEGVKKNWEKIKKEKKYRGVGHAIERIFYFIGDMIKVILNALGPVLGFVLVIIGLLILLGVFGSLIFTYGAISISNHGLSMFAAPEIFNLITDSTFAMITYIGIILLIGIPIVGIIYSGVRLLFRVKSRNKIFNAAAGSLWFIGLFMLILTGIGIGKDFRLETEKNEKHLLKYQNSDTLFIRANEDTLIRGDFFLMYDEVKIKTDEGQGRIYLRPEFDIIRSYGDKVELEISKTARGRNMKSAKSNVNNVVFDWLQDSSGLIISQYYTLKKNKKWRNQELELTIKLPVGKVVYLDPSLEHIIYDVDNVGGMLDEDMLGKVWVMTEEGLKLHIAPKVTSKEEVDSIQ